MSTSDAVIGAPAKDAHFTNLTVDNWLVNSALRQKLEEVVDAILVASGYTELVGSGSGGSGGDTGGSGALSSSYETVVQKSAPVQLAEPQPLSPERDAVSDAVRVLDSRITAMRPTLEQLTRRIKALEDTPAAPDPTVFLRTSLESVEKSLAALGKRLHDLEAALQGHKDGFDRMCEKIENTRRDSSAQKLAATVEKESKQLRTLSGNVAQVTGTVQTLQSTLGELQDQVSKVPQLAHAVELIQTSTAAAETNAERVVPDRFVPRDEFEAKMLEITQATATAAAEDKDGSWLKPELIEPQHNDSLVVVADGGAKLKPLGFARADAEKKLIRTNGLLCDHLYLAETPESGRLPADNAWLKIDLEGEVIAATLPPSLKGPSSLQRHRAIPCFKDLETLEESTVTVDDEGYLHGRGLFVDSPHAVIHQGQVLLGVKDTTLRIGARATNMGIGENALGALRDPDGESHSWAVGEEALSKNRSGKHNVAFGTLALSQALTSELAAFGNYALRSAENVQGCAAFGFRALAEIKHGHHSTAFGHLALTKALGSANTAFGSGCLSGCVSAESCTAMGAGAGQHVVNAKGVVALGDDAGPEGDFPHSISIGHGAHARTAGDLALGSEVAPLKTSDTATSASLNMISPMTYLQVTINGQPYKLAMYAP